MNASARRIVETLALASTALLLLGHGGDVPTCFAYTPTARTYNVVGTCGPAGVITVATTPCSVTVTGDDVGLPLSGNLGANLDRGFDLYGSINSDWDLACGAGPVWQADGGAPAGSLDLLCRRRMSPSNPGVSTDEVDWCQAHLVPVTPTCDIHACAAVTCASTEHTAFAPSGCCPICVANGPNDIIPVPPPPVCHRETCPQSCPAGEEFMATGACCDTCKAPAQTCLDGRTQWLTEVQDRWSSARACAVDADCTISTVGSQCESTCPDAIATDQIAGLASWAAMRGTELCASCDTTPPACAAVPPSRPACTNGTCVTIGL